MTLTLTIQGLDRLDNGEPPRIVFDRHGGVIGRSPLCDWCLPDAKSFISSRHAEITYRGGDYVLTDISTNGTQINGQADRMTGPYTLRSGDTIVIGHYKVRADVVSSGQAQAVPMAPAAAETASAWWGEEHQAPQGPSSSSWDEPAAPPASAPGTPDPWGPMNTESTPVASWPPPNVAAPTDTTPGLYEAPKPNASLWQQAVADYQAPPPLPQSQVQADIWGNFAASNSVDWARGGFGASAAAAASPASAAPSPATPQFVPQQPQPAAFAPQPTAPQPQSFVPPSSEPAAAGWGAPDTASPEVTAPPQPVLSSGGAGAQSFVPPGNPAPVPQSFAPPVTPQPVAAMPIAAMPGADQARLMNALLGAMGLTPGDVKEAPETVMSNAGGLLRRLIAGLVVMLEARARAKAQMGAEATLFSFDGNNPLKFATSTEKALAQLLSPPERGFMPADRAIEDGFKDLQAHQMATLAAMQGALRATLARFSPTAIKARAEQRGFLAKIIPAARESTLWQAYEKEFSGVAEGSDEVFMDAFSKAFKEAYEKASREMRS